MQTLLLILILAAMFRNELAHVATWLRTKAGAAIGSITSSESFTGKPAIVMFSVGVLCGVLVAGVVPRLVKVDWPEWVKVIPIPNIVVESGPRNILIVRESTPDQNTQLDSTLTQLQNGAASAAIQAKGHSVVILDPDAKNASGQPAAGLKPWFEKFPSRQSPVVIISDKAGKVLYAEPLSETAKLADIVAIVEAND